MVSEVFASGDSFLHRYDPRDKIIVAVLFSIVVALADRPAVLTLACIFSVIMVLLARLSFRQLLIRLAIVNIFIGILWLFLPFTYNGEAFFSIGPLAATKEGIIQSLTITVKSNAIILVMIALLGTSDIFSLVHALRHLKVPDKLVHLFFFCFRYIHVLQQEYIRLSHAARIRNFTPGTNLHTYRTYAYLVGMLLVNSYDRSNRIYQAMLCRGFTGKYPVLNHFEGGTADTVVLTLMLVYIAFLVTVQWIIM